MRTDDPCLICGNPCEHTYCGRACTQAAYRRRRYHGVHRQARSANIAAVLAAHPHPDRLTRTVRELRTSGLSYGAISTVLGLYEAVDLTEAQVREWCWRMGLPKNPAVARKHSERSAA